MPKPKPDNIVRHEVVLGTAERQILRDAQTAYSINRIATPITNMSGSGFIVAGGAAIIVIDYILDHLGLDPDWREIIEDMTPEQVTEWLESQKLQIGGLIALVNPIFGLPLVAAGVAGVVDDVVDEAARQREEQQTKSFASWGIGFRRFIRGGGF